MLIAEAQVNTERPARYLVQLCRHFSHEGKHLRHRPRTHLAGDAKPSQESPHVKCSDTQGTVSLNGSQCTMRTGRGMLTLSVQAADEDSLQMLQGLIAGHLERFGRRENLKVNWQRSDTPTILLGQTSGLPTVAESKTTALRRHRTTVSLTAIAAVVIAAHLGIGGAVPAALRGSRWTVGIILAVVLVKVTAVAVLVLRRRCLRRVVPDQSVGPGPDPTS